MKTSARNQFPGTITSVKTGAVNDEIVLRTKEGLEIVAIITHASTVALGLAPGKEAYALIKASSIIVMMDADKVLVSARNCLRGKLSAVTKGAVNAEVQIDTPDGARVAAIVTNESADRLDLATGKEATAIFKASSVLIAVDD